MNFPNKVGSIYVSGFHELGKPSYVCIAIRMLSIASIKEPKSK